MLRIFGEFLLRAGVAASFFIPSLSASAADDGPYKLVMSAERTFVAAQAFEPIDGRWIGVGMVGFSSGGDGRKLYQKIFSVDCREPRGVESIAIFLNSESDANKSPKWVGGMGEKYVDGFNPKVIKHSPLKDFQKEMATLANLPDVKLTRPDDAELAVEFGCAVAERGLSADAAAKLVTETGGAQDLVQISCVLDEPGRKPWRIRFSEEKGWVQVNEKWVEKVKVNPDDVRWIYSGNQYLVDRHRGFISVRSGEYALSGSCVALDPGKRKF